MENKKNMSLVWSVVICVLVVAVLVFISLNKNQNMTSNNDTGMNDNVSAPMIPANPPVATPAPTSGQVAKTGDTVSMNYTGRLQDGTVFDSNVDPKFNHVQPFIFTLGAGQVIPGWDKGIVGMKVGEKKTLTIAPADAYGAQGIPGTIPPNSTLIFDVELLAINPSK